LWNGDGSTKEDKIVFMKQEILESHSKQGFLQYLGVEIISIEKGVVKLSCKKSDKLTQQNGFFHAGVITTIADAACGYAALTMMPKGADVLSVEFKTNLMKPATSDIIIATGSVIKSGRTLVFCEAKITEESEEITFATLQGTMICIQSK
jgi:uncharacterized protein (TIGR00369 family)